jgi:hypothetical protein
MEGTEKYRDDLGCLNKFGGFHNRFIRVVLRGKEFSFKAYLDLVKEVEFW